MTQEPILLIPEYSHELRGSILQVTQHLLATASKRDDIRLIVPYPKEGSRWKGWMPEKWGVSGDNIEFVPVLMDRYSECALGRVSSDWANPKFGGRKDYFVVATMRSTSPIGIRRLFSKPMVGFYPEIANLYLIGGIDYFKNLASDLPDEMLFHCLHSWNLIYGTEGYAGHMLKKFSELFIPSVCKKVRARSTHVNLGIDLQRLKNVQAMEKEPGQIRIAYGGRLVAEKGVFDYLEMGEKLHAMGKPVEMGFYFVFDRWVGDEDKAAKFRRPFCKVEVNATPIEENFFAYAKSSDLFISTAKYEAAALAFQEMLYLGVPGFFLEANFVRGLVPPDYPYVYKTKGDLFQGVHQACNRLQAGETLYDMDKMRQFIVDNHDRDKCDNLTLDFLVNLSRAKRERRLPGSIGELLCA